MDIEHIRHDYLKKCIEEVKTLNENTPEETVDRFFLELRHSCLISAGSLIEDYFNFAIMESNMGDFGLLFTDMDEFRKVFPGFEAEPHVFEFKVYMDMLSRSKMDGFLINSEGDVYFLTKDILDIIKDTPLLSYPSDDSYTSGELKRLKDSINNESLEKFIANPNNIARYEELFSEISKSTILTVRLLKEDLHEYEEDGIICLKKIGPLGTLHMENLGGRYATVFTSEEKTAGIDTPFNKYLQIVNFSQLTNLMLCDDMDGIIINPCDEHILLSREILLEYSPLIEKTCNDYKLNSAIFHIFPTEV